MRQRSEMRGRVARAAMLTLAALVVASCGREPEAVITAEASTAGQSESGDQARHVAASLPGAPGDGIIVQKNVMVRMRDGARLATDIYRPAKEGRYPVVLIRTPYGSETRAYAQRAHNYVKHGYVFAVQDCRGKYDSEGDWYGKRNEAEDGSDAITWLGTRSWSNGNVGMTGGSYLGLVQYWVSDQQNPYLKALVPQVAPVTLGREVSEFDRLATYSGRDSFFNISWMVLTDGRVIQNDWDLGTFDQAWDHLPRADYPWVFGREMQWWPFMLNQRYGLWEEYFLRAASGEWSEPIADDDWWKGYQERYRKVRVPMLHISGWYDCCGEPMIKNFQLVREHATDPVARNNQQLLFGPWHHHWGSSKNGEVDFGPAARMDPDEVALQWFDHWLKGENSGAQMRPAVRYFVMGENKWREAQDWPIPGTQFTKFYLHSKGEARLTQGGGQLSTQLPGDELADHYTYDPGTTPQMSTASLEGPADLTSVEQRDDVLVYTSEVLTAPLEVTGSLSAVLYVGTSAPSTDFFVRLIDVQADGKPYHTFNAETIPYRTHWAKEVEKTADGTRIIKADIALAPTSVLFQAGHRIRVEISSSWVVGGMGSDLPKYGSRGLNVDSATESTATQWNVAKQTIYHDKAHPSHIVLPVIPR